jgi:hypothetical protein
MQQNSLPLKHPQELLTMSASHISGVTVHID